jgi:hypothetical protein
MQDLWEIMGRMITTATLRDDIFSDATFAQKNKAIPCGIEIDSTKYDALDALLQPIIENGPVSLFSRGELLRTLPSRTFERSIYNLAKLLHQSEKESTTFQTALGVLAIDTKFRDQFRAFPDLKSAQIYFRNMNQREFDALNGLIADKNGPFSVLATQMCNQDWDPICHGILIRYANATQRHPILAPPPAFLV